MRSQNQLQTKGWGHTNDEITPSTTNNEMRPHQWPQTRRWGHISDYKQGDDVTPETTNKEMRSNHRLQTRRWGHYKQGDEVTPETTNNEMRSQHQLQTKGWGHTIDEVTPAWRSHQWLTSLLGLNSIGGGAAWSRETWRCGCDIRTYQNSSSKTFSRFRVSMSRQSNALNSAVLGPTVGRDSSLPTWTSLPKSKS